MSDNQGAPMARSSRNDYEARATAIQQRIRHLVDELQRLRDLAQRVRPSATDSLHRLLQLHAEIRPVTQLLRTHITSYLRASREWDDAVIAFNLHEDRSSWAQTMIQQRTLFFHGLSLSSMSLDFQLTQLLQDYRSTLDDIEAFIRSDSAPADAPSAATPAQSNSPRVPAVAHPATNGSTAPAATHPVANGTVHGSNTFAAAHPAVNKDRRTSSTATRRSSAGIRPVPATHTYRSDRPHEAQTRATARDVPRSTSLRSAAVPTPAQQSSTRPSSSGQVITFVNSSMRRGPRTAGIMAHAEGDISNAIPLAWQPAINSGPVQSSYGHGYTSDSVPSRTVVPEHNPRLQQVMLNCAKQGHGHNTAPTRPLTVGADGKPLHASNDAQATFSAPVDHGSHCQYRYRTAHARQKELPLTPFDGDIRRYPSFRNRFLEIVEAHRNLEPRHKLQYLLQFLRGEPLRLAEGFPISDTSFFHVTNQLEERYGNTTRIRKVLTSDLLHLQPPGRSTASLRHFYDQVSRVNAELHELGPDARNSDVLCDILMEKLTVDLRLAVVKDAAYQNQKTVSSVLRALRLHLHTLEEAADAGFNWSSQPQGGATTLWSGPPGRFDPTNNRGNNQRSSATDAAFSYVADMTGTTCAFCSSCAHHAFDCHVYATVPARLRRLHESKRCFLCLQEGHQSRSCPQQQAPLAGQHFYHRALRESLVPPAPMDDNKTQQRQIPAEEMIEKPRQTDGISTDHRPAVPSSLPSPTKPLNWARTVSSSCPRTPNTWSHAGNSETDPYQPKELRTALGRGSTTQPPAATTAWSKMERGTDASSDDDSLLSRRQTPCTTAVSKGHETTQSDRDSTRASRFRTSHRWDWSPPSVAPEDARRHCMRSFEEVSSHRRWSQNNNSRFDSDAGPTAVPTSATTTAVLVECVKTHASASPSISAERHDAVAFFDSGSSGSYITQDLMNRLQLQPHRKRMIRTNTFGRSASRDLEVLDTTVTLWTTDGRLLLLDVIALETIAASVNTTLVDQLDLLRIRENGQAIRPTRLAPDILIGQDLIHLFQRQQLPALPHGFAVTTTRLGVVVGGAGRTFMDSSEVTAAPSSTHQLSPLDGHQQRDFNLPHYYHVRDLMEPLTSRPPKRTPANSAGRRTEPPVLTTPGTTELRTVEIHEEGCFYCSLTEEPVANDSSGGKAHPAAPPEPVRDEVPALEASHQTALREAKHTLQRLLNPPDHQPQEKTTPLDTTQPFLLAPSTIDAPSQDKYSTARDAQLNTCAERSTFEPSPTTVPLKTHSAPAALRIASAALYDSELCTTTPPTLMVHLPLHGTFLQFFEPLLCVSVVYFHYSDRKHAPEGTPSALVRTGSRRENLRQGLRSRGRRPTDAKPIQRPLIAETTAVFADFVHKFLDGKDHGTLCCIQMGRRSRNKRISKRGKEISPPKDKHSYWVPADDDVNSDDQIVEGGPMRLATPSPNAASTSASAHPAENEGEDTSASAHSADNEPVLAAQAGSRPTSPTTDKILQSTRTNHSDVLSEATPHHTPARTADVSDPQGDETEENSASAHPAENEEESAAVEDPAARTDARTLSQLQQYIHQEHVQLPRARHNIPDAPHLPQIWSDAWKQSDDTKHLWQLFHQLQPIVASRQADDLQRLYGDNTIAQSTSSTSQQDTSEAAASAEPMDESSAEAAVTDTSAVSASALDTSDTPSDLDYRTDQTRSPQYERISTPQHSSRPAQPVYVLPPPPPPPQRLSDPRRPSTITSPAAPELDDMLVDFRRPPTPSTLRTDVPHRNPSPPPSPARPAAQFGEAVTEPTRTAADVKQARQSKEAEVEAAHPAANTSKSKSSGHSQKTTVRTIKKSGHTSAARDGTNSRSSTGSKRSRVSDGRSHPPPCKRIGSRSPTRKPSPSIARHVQRKKTSQHRNMVPVIDGCVYKDMAIDLAKGQHQPAAWQQEFDLPHNPYEMLGVINHLCVPSTNLPADVVIRHEATPLTPYVDQTFDQALLENTIIPWPYILGSTIGCAPTYWQQTGTKAREYLYKAADRRHLYRNKLKAIGIGPTGFDLRSGGNLITGEYAGQRENIVRYARIARNNLHVEAIKALRGAGLSSRHRIHLVAFKATALDLTLWLEEFPRTVISMDLDLLHGLNKALHVNNGDAVYRHATALKKFFTHVPMANLGLHSGCPLSLTVPGTYRTPSMLLRAAQQFEQLTGTHGDHLHEHNAANLVAMYDLNPDLLDRATNTKDLRDPAIGPRLTIRELSFTIRALYGAPPRVDLRGQERTPSRRRSSIAEASPAAERMDTDEAPTTSRKKQARSRSSASKSRREPSPPRRPGGRRHSPARRSRMEAPRPDPAHSAGDSHSKKAASKGLNPAHPAGDKPSKDRSAPSKPTAAKEAAYAPVKAVPITCPPGSRLQGRLGSLLVPSSSSKPPAPSKPKTSQGFQPRQPDYTGPPKQVFLNMTQPAPERTEERRIVIRAPDPRFFKTQPAHEAVLPQEPTIVDICNHFEQYFHEEDPDAALRKVYDGSLSTTAMPFAQGEYFDVPREPGRHPGPWDPTKTCRCRNVERELHQTTEEFGLITKKKWANKDVIRADKTGKGLKQILGEAMQLEIQSFGQMIFLKYADRLIGNDFQAGWILRFMFEVLQTTDWPGLIDLLREFQKRMVPNESREPWPTHADVYAAAESWCCYCPEAYAYLYARLSGPVTFDPDWLSVRMMPAEMTAMLETLDAAALFDYLRNRLYSQYALPHIKALEEYQPQLVWTRFEKTNKSKGELCPTEDRRTIVFVDDSTYEQFSANLREDVAMIRVDVSSRAKLLHDIRTPFPTSKVQRVVFWFGRRILLDNLGDLCQLLAESGHHYEAHFPNIEKYVVMPFYVRRLCHTWSSQVLGTYLQRDEILPNTRVVILSSELQLWDFDRRAQEAGEEDPQWPVRSIDEEGHRLTDTVLFLDRLRLRSQHDLDLWIELDEATSSATGAATHSVANPEASTSATTDTSDIVGVVSSALPANVLTKEVKDRLRHLQEQLTTQATQRAKEELQPQLTKVDAIYDYLMQQQQELAASATKTAKKKEHSRSASRRRSASRSRSSSRSSQDKESEH